MVTKDKAIKIATALDIPVKNKPLYKLIKDIKDSCGAFTSITKQRLSLIALAFGIPVGYKTKAELIYAIKEKCFNLKSSSFKIQAVLFPLASFNMVELNQWLLVHKLEPLKIVIEGNFYRVRILEPLKSYKYITKILNNGIRLVLVSPP